MLVDRGARPDRDDEAVAWAVDDPQPADPEPPQPGQVATERAPDQRISVEVVYRGADPSLRERMEPANEGGRFDGKSQVRPRRCDDRFLR